MGSFHLIILVFDGHFYKVLKTLSVPLEINYLAIVSSLYLLPFVKGSERTSQKWAIMGGIQNSQRKEECQKEEVAQRGK